MADIRTHLLPGPCGDISVADAGPPDGFPVLIHAGSPGSRRIFAPAAEHAAREHGLRLISYDRPGYGDTPARPGRTVADGAAEARQIAAGLGLARIAVWGFSGGGAYALACAALLPDLVRAACVFASLAPHDADGLDFCAGWPDEYRTEVDLFFGRREVARERWRADADRLYPVLSTAQGWLDRWGAAAETDAAHGRDVAEYLAADQRDALARGDQGWWDDWAAALSPWGFDPAAIAVPVQLWHGESDRAVPIGHGRWLAARVPGIDAHLTEADDHTTIEEDHRCEAYRWLALQP